MTDIKNELTDLFSTQVNPLENLGALYLHMRLQKFVQLVVSWYKLLL